MEWHENYSLRNNLSKPLWRHKKVNKNVLSDKDPDRSERTKKAFADFSFLGCEFFNRKVVEDCLGLTLPHKIIKVHSFFFYFLLLFLLLGGPRHNFFIDKLLYSSLSFFYLPKIYAYIRPIVFWLMKHWMKSDIIISNKYVPSINSLPLLFLP